jgi:hypothetical protein
MSRLLSWLKSSSTKILDPQREQRVKDASVQLERELASKRSKFLLKPALAGLQVFQEDAPAIVEQTYRSLLARAWRDAEFSDGERRTLDWAAGALELSHERTAELDQDAGMEAFRSTLGRSFEDGRLDNAEVKTLRRISQELSVPLGELFRKYFSREGAGFLRSMFAEIAQDGRIVEHEWSSLVQTVSGLGLSRNELLDAVQQQAERFVEQTLAEAKADERLSEQEERTINWLLQNVIGRAEYRTYVRNEVDFVKRIESIEAGRLPSLNVQRIGIRAGEIVHAEASAMYSRTRQLRTGTRTDQFDGVLTLTDNRLIFSSALLSLDVNHRRVLDFTDYSNGFEITVTGKGSGFYVVADPNGMFNRIYRTSIRMANQTVVRQERSTRHIHRDVRQRVWQRYGGRCAECGAAEYLEFDHIIPVAKGGGNADNNVQLLCRGCNGRKSDHI